MLLNRASSFLILVQLLTSQSPNIFDLGSMMLLTLNIMSHKVSSLGVNQVSLCVIEDISLLRQLSCRLWIKVTFYFCMAQLLALQSPWIPFFTQHRFITCDNYNMHQSEVYAEAGWLCH